MSADASPPPTIEERLAKLEAAAGPLKTLLDGVVKQFLPELAELIARPRAVATALLKVLRAKGFTAEADAFEAAYNREMADAALAALVKKLTNDWERARGGGDVPPDDQAGR